MGICTRDCNAFRRGSVQEIVTGIGRALRLRLAQHGSATLTIRLPQVAIIRVLNPIYSHYTRMSGDVTNTHSSLYLLSISQVMNVIDQSEPKIMHSPYGPAEEGDGRPGNVRIELWFMESLLFDIRMH